MNYLILKLKSTGLILLALFFLLSAISSIAKAEDQFPLGIILTWQQDPTTTMTIDWHTTGSHPSTLEYKKSSAENWSKASGERFDFPYSNRNVHRVELTGLQADTEYLFRLDAGSPSWKFRTMPAVAGRPVRIAIGGDVRHQKEWMKETNRQAASYDPDFIIWGGDLAYADGREERLYRWYEFFDAMLQTLVTQDGRIIPVLAGIGNHEVRGGYFHNDSHSRREDLPPYRQDDASRKLIAPYYYTLFAFPGQPGYGVLDFGDYMSVILLDSDHSNPVDGLQTRWLEQVLRERSGRPHIFPVYHVPAYPSVRSPDGFTTRRIRENWVPLFEQYGVRVAFENHDHIYKRTHPLRNGKISPDGIVYMGDGAWGVRTREPGGGHDKAVSYLGKVASQRHFILATIQGVEQHFAVINENGVVIDMYPRISQAKPDSEHKAVPYVFEQKTDN